MTQIKSFPKSAVSRTILLSQTSDGKYVVSSGGTGYDTDKLVLFEMDLDKFVAHAVPIKEITGKDKDLFLKPKKTKKSLEKESIKIELA